MKKNLNTIFNPLILILCWLIYVSSFLSGIVRYHFIQNPNTGFEFLGSISNIFWHLSPIFMAIFITFLIVYCWHYVCNNANDKTKFVFYILGFFSICTFIVSNYLLFLELSKYGNFLYSSYGITKDAVFNLSSVSLVTMTVLLGTLYFSRSRLYKKMILSRSKIVALLVIAIPIWYSIMSLVKISDYYWYVKFSHSHLFTNYESILEVKNNVPVNGVVVIPSQTIDWPDIGNATIVRYFLFPRIIVSGSFFVNQASIVNFSELYFISIHKEDKEWPIINSSKRSINFGMTDLFYSKLELIRNDKSGNIYKVIF